MTGYWGKPTAVHQFCEPKYATTPYVAEFYNSISSFWYCGAAMYAMSDPALRKDFGMVAASFAALAIGLGSAAFHGTMLFEYELCDEVPMLIFISVCMVNKCGCHAWLLTPARKKAFTFAVSAACLCTIAAYAVLQNYSFFVLAFTIMVLVDLALAVTWRASQPVNWFAVKQSTFWIALGKFVWEVEVGLCSADARVWPLHVLWHLFSMLSVYFGLLADMTARIECGVSPSAEGCRSVPLSWLLVPYPEVIVGTCTPSPSSFSSSSSLSFAKSRSRSRRASVRATASPGRGRAAHADDHTADGTSMSGTSATRTTPPKQRRPVTGTRAKRK